MLEWNILIAVTANIYTNGVYVYVYVCMLEWEMEKKRQKYYRLLNLLFVFDSDIRWNIEIYGSPESKKLAPNPSKYRVYVCVCVA